MKNLLAITFIHLLASSLFAQEPLQKSAHTETDNFPSNHQTLVFGDKVNVRTAPDKDAQVLTQLLAGEAVIVLSMGTEPLTQNGWTRNWAKIAFNKNGKRQEGYVWGGLLSFSAVQAGDVSFVYSVMKKSENDSYGAAKYEIEIRAIRNNQIISSVKTEIEMETGYYTEAYLYGNLGLEEYKNVLSFHFSYDGCGYPQYEIWLLWDSSKLEPLPVLNSSYNGDIFSESEEYIFPENETGHEGVLLYKHEYFKTVTDAEGESEYDRSERVRKMIWNGKAWEKPNLEDEDAGRK